MLSRRRPRSARKSTRKKNHTKKSRRARPANNKHRRRGGETDTRRRHRGGVKSILRDPAKSHTKSITFQDPPPPPSDMEMHRMETGTSPTTPVSAPPPISLPDRLAAYDTLYARIENRVRDGKIGEDSVSNTMRNAYPDIHSPSMRVAHNV